MPPRIGDDDILAVQALREQGMTIMEISQQLGRTKHSVAHIVGLIRQRQFNDDSPKEKVAVPTTVKSHGSMPLEMIGVYCHPCQSTRRHPCGQSWCRHPRRIKE